MVIASTIASAAMGTDIVSSRIIRELARERGGTRGGDHLVRRRAQAARRRRGARERGDERRRRLGRQRSAQHRAHRHDRLDDRDRDGRAHRRGRPRRARGDGARLRDRGARRRGAHPGPPRARLPWVDLHDLRRRGRGRNAAQADAGADDAGDRARRHLDRRHARRRQYQRRARVPRGTLGDARRQCGARRAARGSWPRSTCWRCRAASSPRTAEITWRT